MPLLFQVLLGGLIAAAPTVVGRVLLALGIGVVSYTGISASLAWLKDQAVAAFTGLPAQMVSVLSYMKVGNALSVIMSAIAVRLLLDGLTSDTVKRWVTR